MISALLRRLRLWAWRFERDLLISDLARLQAEHRILVPRWRQRVSDLQRRITLEQKAAS